MRQIAIKPHVDGLFLLTSTYQTAFLTTFDMMSKKSKRVYLRSQSIHVKKFSPTVVQGLLITINSQLRANFLQLFPFLGTIFGIFKCQGRPLPIVDQRV